MLGHYLQQLALILSLFKVLTIFNRGTLRARAHA